METDNLRLVQQEDLPMMLAWRNSPRIRRNMFSDHIISWEEHLHWFQTVQDDLNAIHFLYEMKGKPVGTVNFTSIDRKDLRCMWGFYIGMDGLPKGTGIRMACLALDYAFDNLNMRKVCAEVLARNSISTKFHLKLGFLQEGYFQEHVLKENTYHDVLYFSLFKDQWFEKRQSLVAGFAVND